MNKLSALLPTDGPALLRVLSLLAIAVGIGVWGALLLAPAPGALPPTLAAASNNGQDTTAVARWFGGGTTRVRVAVVGLIATNGDRGAALLAVNGGPPQAYRVGQTLAPGVTLAAVSPSAVSVDQDGIVEEVAVPRKPAHSVQGFIPVPIVAQQTRP